MTAFAARLQDAVDPDVVRADLAGVVQVALEPTHVSVWLGQCQHWTVSNLDPAPEAINLTAGVASAGLGGASPQAGSYPAVDVIEARKAAIGDGTEVRRLLPQRTLRTIGAWCFLDHYGPDEVSRGPGMQVPPHPHIGLQTVSWLFQGLVLHRDSLGSRQLIRPGELNLMTAGRGITHSEESAAGRPPVLHGLQLWIALPEAERHAEPRFAHHADLPVVRGRRQRDRRRRRVPGRAVPGQGVQPAGRVRGRGPRRG